MWNSSEAMFEQQRIHATFQLTIISFPLLKNALFKIRRVHWKLLFLLSKAKIFSMLSINFSLYLVNNNINILEEFLF